eukprot:scaffold21940_cov98-Skeletonema_marinoi.AAC.2
MSDDLWETIDWGDDVDDSTHPSQATVMSPTFFHRKETAATARLSGLSAGSESDKPSDPSTTVIICPERKQHARNKRSSWFDADLTKLVPLEDEQGGYRTSGRPQLKGSNTRVENETRRKLRRRQSDYAIEKRRASEKHASLDERRPVSRSLTKRLLSSVGLRRDSEAASVSDDEELDVPFPTNTRRQSCF